MPTAKSEQLPKESQKSIRDAILKEGIFLGTRSAGLSYIEIVTIPDTLQTAYSKQPKLVVELLLKMAEEERPLDSMKAVAYAISLLDDPARGVVFVRLFDESKYDSSSAGGTTVRQKLVEEVKKLRRVQN